jgi:hypothetical protein
MEGKKASTQDGIDDTKITASPRIVIHMRSCAGSFNGGGGETVCTGWAPPAGSEGEIQETSEPSEPQGSMYVQSMGMKPDSGCTLS